MMVAGKRPEIWPQSFVYPDEGPAGSSLSSVLDDAGSWCGEKTAGRLHLPLFFPLLNVAALAISTLNPCVQSVADS